ncbi:hypothetical protein [uncultured Alsobacter sp.]|uniref:hypothetical protein n=1 Tax=uncultured Alsobacter sp. TaxID=1748258 RepID=UPI0025E2BDA1|nr:hypothetical protein [uncultured Alsobacter sp.]
MRPDAKTEAEANKSWCPLGIPNEAIITCAGAKCMAWVWTSQSMPEFIEHTEPEAVDEPPRPAWVPPDYRWTPHDEDGHAGWLEPVESFQAKRKGRCGMVPGVVRP